VESFFPLVWCPRDVLHLFLFAVDASFEVSLLCCMLFPSLGF
jgi:hypothetical protein